MDFLNFFPGKKKSRKKKKKNPSLPKESDPQSSGDAATAERVYKECGWKQNKKTGKWESPK